MPGLTHWQSPKFMAFFPAASTYPGILGELYSATFNAAAFNWMCSPAITELETVMMDWVAGILAMPSCFLSTGEGGGVIQGTTSEAIVVAMIAARERLLQQHTEDLPELQKEKKKIELRGRLVALGSDQTHSSTEKAAKILGVYYESVPTSLDDAFALRGSNLRKMTNDCKSRGLLPFYLTATLGSTSTCAVDRFDEIADVLQEFPDIWIHVDAAYAGAALVCEEYQFYTKHFVHFDSFCMNMHKWLLTNFDARLVSSYASSCLLSSMLISLSNSCMFVKKRIQLTSALSVTAAYLRNSYSESGLVTDYRDWQIPLGRRFRALKIWFVLRTYGTNGLKAHIRQNISHGEIFHNLILTRPDLFRVVTPPAFALNVISVIPPALEAPNAKDSNSITIINEQENVNRITEQVHKAIVSHGEILITNTVVNGMYAIRFVSANPRSEEKYVRRAFDILVEMMEKVCPRGKEQSAEKLKA